MSDKNMMYEHFTIDGEATDMDMLDFWNWTYSNIYDLQDTIAEYIVAKALGLEKAFNVDYWTLFDILYREKRIEVKETSYYHSWQTDEEPKSEARNFGITKAYSEYKDSASSFERQNDIYIFCLNTGYSRSESNPLNLNNWEFYVVPTSIINDLCKNAKTISLSRLRKITKPITYKQLKTKVDEVIDLMISSS